MALFGSSDESIGVKISTSADTKGIDSTSKSIDQLTRATDNSSHSFGLFSKMAGAVASLGLAAGFTASAKAAIGSAASFEQTRIGIENMLGSADKAGAVLKDLSKFAAVTPFQFPEIAGSVKQLLAFGFNAEDAVSTMKELGDISAAVGAPIGDLSYLMGTLKTQGRAFTIDLRQFASRGIPIYEYLAKVLGTNEAAIIEMTEAGKIGFPEVQKAFTAMTAQGGKFHGTMAKQSKSLSGLWSTLKDNIGLAGREIVGINQAGDVRDGSIFDKLRNGVNGLNKSLSNIDWVKLVDDISNKFGELASSVSEVARKVGDYLGPKFEALWNTIVNKLAPALANFYEKIIKPLLPILGTLLVAAIGLVTDALNILLAALTPVINFMADNEEVVLAFAAAFGLLATKMAFGATVTAFNAAMDLAMGKLTVLNGFLTGFGGFAVLAGAAVFAGLEIVKAAEGAKKAWQGAMDAADSYGKSQDAVIKKYSDLYKSGKISKEAYVKALNNVASNADSQVQKRASGGPVSAGRPYIVGEQGQELFVPNQSGTIVPAGKTSQMLSGSQSTTTYNIQSVNLSTGAAVAEFFKIQDTNALLISKGLSPVRV